MSLSLIEAIALFGAIQGFFLGLFLPFIANSNKQANRILSAILFICTIMLVGRILYFRFPINWPHQITLIPDVVIYLFGPLLWFYVYTLVKYPNHLPPFYKVHFIPAVLHLIGVLYFMSYSGAEYMELMYTGKLNLYFQVSEIFAIVSNFAYLLLSFKEVNSNQQTFSKNIGVNFKKYLRGLLFLLSIIICVWAMTMVFGKYFKLPYSYNYIWIIIPTISVFIGYNAINKPELFKLFQYKPSILSDTEVELMTQNLNTLMHEEKIFKDSKLTLNETATKLNTSPNKLSWLLNKSYGTSFYDFINKYRVEETIFKLRNGEHQIKTLLGIAYESGFNSKTTFNKSFKQHMGETPSSYVKRQQ